jgi:hypothetical protein
LINASIMRRRRKLNVVHHGDPSLEKEQPIDSSNEVNKEGSHIETHCKYIYNMSSCLIIALFQLL